MSDQSETLTIASPNDNNPITIMAHALASDPEALCMDGMSVWDLMQSMANAKAMILLGSGMSAEEAHQRMRSLYDIMVQAYEMNQEGGTA